MTTTISDKNLTREALDRDPFWYKTGVIYELHVRAFCDSDGNGIGDFKGLASRLDYLKDLGVTALWLLPFYPSPLRDDGYDIADYYGVHPNYGTLDDFKTFLEGAHQRGLRVITELVMNHTSDQHPAAVGGTFMSGATPRTVTRAHASFSRTLKSRIGPGTTPRTLTIGTAFSLINPTLISTIRRSLTRW
jgi:1,4-alpha-glucan branching enzyme